MSINFRKSKYLILGFLVASFGLPATSTFAKQKAPRSPRSGIAGGNHMVSTDFDFKMTIPSGWEQDPSSIFSSRKEASPAEIWRVSNTREAGATNASKMQVEFYSSIEIKDMQALRSYVEANYPDNKWSDHVDSRLAGLRSNEIPDPTDDKAKLGHLFYFMDRNMIVAIHWRRHPAFGGDRGISELLLSMDRRTAPPILRSIEYSTPGPLKPGDPLCIYLNVDDLKSSFDSSSLSRLAISGLAKSFVWHDANWDEQNGRFNVCFRLPSAIRASADLQVIDLQLSNERESTLYCSMSAPSIQLRCNPWLPTMYPIEQTPPVIENSTPDRQGPEIDGMDIEQTENRVTLKFRAHDGSGIAGGWLKLQQIPGDDTDIFIAPWQLQNGQFDIDLTKQSTSGTRRVTKIVLADVNSISAAYVDCNLVKETTTERLCRLGFYARCLDGKICESTNLPVIEYFSSKRR